MAKKTPQYDNQSITMLKGADRVRKRPAVIFGSDGLEGCEHSYFEILSNAVDEAREGYGDRIITTVFADRSIMVEDFGRGVPLDFNETEGRYNWELVYCELYAGGKYANNDSGAAYEYSLGLNGLGACATQYSSEYMDVISYSGGVASSIHFKKGEPVSDLEKEPIPGKKPRTGTTVKWRPDLEVFTDTAIPREFFLDTLKKQAVVNAGITFVLRFEEEGGKFTEESFLYGNGISDYIREIAGETAMTEPVLWKLETKGRDRDDKDEYKLRAEIAFCVSGQVNVLEYYHNSSFLEHGGSPEKAVRTAFTYAVDKKLKAAGKYNKNESKITFQDIQDCLIVVTNSFSTQTSYANQTKKAITNTFIAEAMTAFLKEQLEIYFMERPAETEKFLNQVLVNKRSRENAESTRLNLKKKLQTSTGVGADRVEKFVSCRSKDPTRRELYIVEGDSALTSVKLSRDAEFQAVIPIRGKTLNCLKSTYDRIFKSEIIVDLLRVIGCGVELKGKVKSDAAPFDINSLKWSKIIFCTDADEDGFQIRTLLLTIFYRLLPTLIQEGKIYIAESPLFEITTKKETLFAYNEPEKAEIVARLEKEGVKYTLQRSKGLGENDPQMMAMTTMNPATRRLIRVNPTDAAATARMFETLLGDDLPARKEFITRYGAQYWDAADI